MAPSAVLERIRKLEARGYITSYETRLAPKLLGLGLTAFIFVRSDETSGWDEISGALAAIPEVQEVHNIAGEDCFLVKVRLRDTDHLALMLRDKLRTIPHIRSTRTTIVLETVKETSLLRLDLDTQEVST
jgi:Lrp/AsnC family leucine-responsive transcriptional regulator